MKRDTELSSPKQRAALCLSSQRERRKISELGVQRKRESRGRFCYPKGVNEGQADAFFKNKHTGGLGSPLEKSHSGGHNVENV